MTDEEIKKLFDVMQNTTCKMIIAELESIREEINRFIDDLIQKEIEKYKE